MGSVKEDQAASAGIVFTLSFIIFIGLFFGLNYHEIVIQKDYFPTECLITGSTIDSNYCSSFSCSGCSESYGLPNCPSLESYINNNLSPTRCATDPSQCGISQPCENGYKCCTTCCQTCTSCSTHCTGSSQGLKKDSLDDTMITMHYGTEAEMLLTGTYLPSNSSTFFDPQGCTTTCTHYSCNCYCCSSVNHRQCYLTVNVCYTALLFITYEDRDGHLVNTSNAKGFGTNLAAAQNYVTNEYQVSQTYGCYYDTTDESHIRWDIRYNKGYWVASGIFAVITFISLVILVDGLINPESDSKVLAYEIEWWAGFILPIVLYLPLYVGAAIDKTGRQVLLVFIFNFVFGGPLPWVFQSGGSYFGGFYFLGAYVFLGWVLPFYPLASNRGSYIASAVTVAFLILIIGAVIEYFRQWKPRRSRPAGLEDPPAYEEGKNEKISQETSPPTFVIGVPPAYEENTEDSSEKERFPDVIKPPMYVENVSGSSETTLQYPPPSEAPGWNREGSAEMV